jgi:glucose/arabinose dehydrogenase
LAIPTIGRAALATPRPYRVAVVALVLACNSERPSPPEGEPPVVPPPSGALHLTIIGVPPGFATVNVSGPNAFAQGVTGTTTLSNLVPGDYTVTATPVTYGDSEYSPQPASQAATVVAGQTKLASLGYNPGPPPPPPPQPFAIRAQEIVGTGLTSPVFLIGRPGDARLFVLEQPGRVRIVRDGVLLATPFVDITSHTTYGGERGLLSLAFDPAYATNGRFYVYYTNSAGDIAVDRHTVTADPDVANSAFDPVIRVEHRSFSNHNGGMVTFGPDGMLYLAPGDGGSGGDPQNNGQNINALLGKLLRLDVRELPYTIPPDNPYVGRDGADEIWAIGLRNPWRFSFDTGVNPAQLYIADVGQNAWEEVNATSASAGGINYGWRRMEATHCYPESVPTCDQTGLTLPVHEYSHSQGCSVTGGYVYRGSAMPEVVGHYFYSDYCSGGLRSFRLVGGAATDHRTWNVGSITGVTSFGLDGVGEMYMTTSNGRVYKLVRQ